MFEIQIFNARIKYSSTVCLIFDTIYEYPFRQNEKSVVFTNVFSLLTITLELQRSKNGLKFQPLSDIFFTRVEK